MSLKKGSFVTPRRSHQPQTDFNPPLSSTTERCCTYDCAMVAHIVLRKIPPYHWLCSFESPLETFDLSRSDLD
jgi:hypothetical protein